MPIEFLNEQTCFGIKFDTVKIDNEKLFVGIAGLFEAVFVLEFEVTQYEHAILQLYDFRIEIEGIAD